MDSIHKLSEDKANICEYLKNGYVMAACGGVVKDIIQPEVGIIGSPDDVTDRVWMWPADLQYYVERYNLLLPSEFIEHMKFNKWNCNSDVVIDYDNLEVI